MLMLDLDGFKPVNDTHGMRWETGARRNSPVAFRLYSGVASFWRELAAMSLRFHHAAIGSIDGPATLARRSPRRSPKPFIIGHATVASA